MSEPPRPSFVSFSRLEQAHEQGVVFFLSVCAQDPQVWPMSSGAWVLHRESTQV